MADKASKSPFLPYLFIVVPVVVSLVVAAIAWIHPLDETQRIQALWTICALILGGTVTTLLRHYELHKGVGEMRASIDGSIENNNNIIKLNQRMMRLEKAMKDDEQFDRIALLNDALGSIIDLRLHHPALSDLVSWRLARISSRAIDEHMELSKGLIYIDDANKELNTNESLLRTLPKSMIRAVSFEDEAFWNSPEGTSMLRAHKEMKEKKGISTKRLFIIEGDASKYHEMFRKQYDHCVEVKYVERSRLFIDVPIEDFVIYDETYLRTGYTAPGKGAAPLVNKYACVTWQKQRVDGYADAFQALWLRAAGPDLKVPQNV